MAGGTFKEPLYFKDVIEYIRFCNKFSRRRKLLHLVAST